jgi:hypothetical protein
VAIVLMVILAVGICACVGVTLFYCGRTCQGLWDLRGH